MKDFSPLLQFYTQLYVKEGNHTLPPKKKNIHLQCLPMPTTHFTKVCVIETVIHPPPPLPPKQKAYMHTNAWRVADKQ